MNSFPERHPSFWNFTGSGDFNVSSCSVSNNGNGIGMYLIYGSSRQYSITSSTFTRLDRPLYMLASYQNAVTISLNRFSENSCSVSNCKSLQIDYFGSLVFQVCDVDRSHVFDGYLLLTFFTFSPGQRIGIQHSKPDRQHLCKVWVPPPFAGYTCVW